MSCPTLQGYITFLTTVVAMNMANLPPFSGQGTLQQGSPVLTLTAVTTGSLATNAIVTDANGAIPATTGATPTTPPTTIVGPVAPNPPVGIGTYQMSAPALSTESVAETITATNQWITTTFGVAMDTVNDAIALEAELYSFAVYNLATDRLVNWAPDITGQTYFKDLRRDMKIERPALGVASSGSDQGTSGTVLNPEFMKQLTLADLQVLRTPWGREYIGIAQSWGSTLWGVS